MFTYGNISSSDEELFVHPMTHYGVDWVEGQSLSEADAATKMVAIDEIMRRQKDRNEMRATQNRPDTEMYHEENGLAFAIGTYLSIGGLPTGQGVNESRSLIDAGKRHTENARRHYAEVLGVPPESLPVDIGILPESIARKLTRLPEGVLYLPGTYTTMAARKQNSRVRKEGPYGLKDIWTKNYRSLYVDEEGVGTQWDDDQIGHKAAEYIKGESEHSASITDQQKKSLGRLASRYFETEAEDDGHASHKSS